MFLPQNVNSSFGLPLLILVAGKSFLRAEKIAAQRGLKAVTQAGDAGIFILKAALSENKRWCIIIDGDRLFGATGRFQFFINLGSAAAGEQPFYGEGGDAIRQPQRLQYYVKQAHAEGYLDKCRLGRRPKTECPPGFCQPV